MPDPGPQPAPRILYIEDNPESRALVRSVLEPRGFDVLEASDGMAGIDLAIASHPDLILCDIQLPGLDGYETARAADGAGDRSVTALGRFIVFEGLDGAGTTTQAKMLAERLQKQGRSVYLAHQPSDGPVGQLIRQILAGRAPTSQADGKLGVVDEKVMALLFAADRLDHLNSQIEPRLARGEDVIVDRYTLSSLAYQGASVSHEFIVAANRFARRPDLTLFLYVPASVALDRVRARGAKLERYETAHQLQAIEREYSRLVGTLASVVSIDGMRPIAEVADLCFAALQQQLG